MSKRTTFKRLLRPTQTEKKTPPQGPCERETTCARESKPWEREDFEMNRGEERVPSPAPGSSADADQGKGDVPTADAAAGPVAFDPGDRGESCAGVGQSASGSGKDAEIMRDSGAGEGEDPDRRISDGSVKKVDPPVRLYTDLSVCRALGIKRRVLAEARTAATRGQDWDAVGDEVGMTHQWVADFAKELGISPDFDRLEPVSGRYVSVRLVGTTPNKCLVQVELEATRTREFARTRNIMDHPIHYREVFCCERISLPTDQHLEWVAAPNEMNY